MAWLEDPLRSVTRSRVTDGTTTTDSPSSLSRIAVPDLRHALLQPVEQCVALVLVEVGQGATPAGVAGHHVVTAQRPAP